jgi:hypothetical protein
MRITLRFVCVHHEPVMIRMVLTSNEFYHSYLDRYVASNHKPSLTFPLFQCYCTSDPWHVFTFSFQATNLDTYKFLCDHQIDWKSMKSLPNRLAVTGNTQHPLNTKVPPVNEIPSASNFRFYGTFRPLAIKTFVLFIQVGCNSRTGGFCIEFTRKAFKF